MQPPGNQVDSRMFRGLAVDDSGGARWFRTASILCQLPDCMAAFDIATLNLFCAIGLSGDEGLDPESCFQQVLRWTKHVENYTSRCLPRYHSAPEEFERSVAKFKMLCMVTALQRDLGVKYYMPFSEGEYNASDSQNLFIHGILSGHGGTCVSMPALYVAIGRRLGYPLHMVRSKEHWFVRWQDASERFNIEATSPGFCPNDDAHYHTNPKPLTEQEIKGGFYLRNLSPREELACFLNQRAHCLLDNLRFADSAMTFKLAHSITADDWSIHYGWAAATVLHSAVARAARNCAFGGDSKIDLRTLRMPEPVAEWERWGMPAARRELDRIISVTSKDCLFLRRSTKEESDGCHIKS